MHSRNFGRDAARVSEVGLGTWQIGGSWGEVSEAVSLAILQAAYERGVTFFDTADNYGDGRSEQIIGKFLRESGADVFVATKQGRNDNPGRPQNHQPEVMRTHIENSLKRLGVEALDLVQLHCIATEELMKGEVFETLRALKQEGKIKRFGASVESVEQANICLQHDDLASLQIIFNIYRQKPIDELFQTAQDKGIALIVRLPLASGLLSGKMTKDTHFAPDDHRNFNANGESFNVGETFAGLPFQKGVELADEIKTHVPEGITMAQMALRWILDFPAVTTVIPGASRVAQVASNVSASDAAPLSDELHAWLRDFYQREVKEFIRGPY